MGWREVKYLTGVDFFPFVSSDVSVRRRCNELISCFLKPITLFCPLTQQHEAALNNVISASRAVFDLSLSAYRESAAVVFPFAPLAWFHISFDSRSVRHKCSNVTITGSKYIMTLSEYVLN